MARSSRLQRWVEGLLGEDGEFLLGDLAEERARRGGWRGAAWFWRQVARAVLAGSPPPAGPPTPRASAWRGLALDLAVFGRKLRRRPVWAAAVVGVLALGVGANAAMFAGFDAWVTRPLPFPEPERLVALTESQPERDVRQQPVSPRTLADWLESQSSFESIDAFERAAFNLADAGDPVRVRGARVTHSLFASLGVAPALGRPLQAGDDRPGQPPTVALISHRLWQERFAGDEGALGATIRLDGRAHEIVGVMPEGFRFPEWHDVWTPLAMELRSSRRDERRLSVVARLAEGVTRGRAQADLERLSAEIARSSPDTSAGWSAEVRPLRDTWVPPVIDVALRFSLAAGALVLIVVCANIASLMLAEASARSRETAIREALGASRWRLARQSLVEGLTLATAAAAIAIAVCAAWSRWIGSLAPTEPPYLFAMRLDARVILYALAMALLGGAGAALAPVLRHSAGRRLAADLAAGGRATSVAAARLRGVLVVGELALSTALVIAALLLVKSFLRQQSVDPGYRTDGVYTMRLSLTGVGFEDAAARGSFLKRLQDELRGAPGVRGVGVSDGLPSEGGLVVRLETPERPAERQQGERALRYAIGGSYLETLEVPIRAGRAFTGTERREGGAVAVVSESLARSLWGGVDVVGRSLRVADEAAPGPPWLRVVGVVGNVRWPEDMVSRGALPVHQLYRPWPEVAGPGVHLVVDSDAPAAPVARSVREAVSRTGLLVPVSEVLSMGETIRRSQWVTRLFGEQLVAYALFALLVAAVGIYGLVADSVVQRRSEIAVRLALGARPEAVRRAVVGGAARLGSAGVALGLVLGTGVSHLSRAMLGGVTPADPGVLVAVVALLGATLLAASYGPAWRASNVDPARALRAE